MNEKIEQAFWDLVAVILHDREQLQQPDDESICDALDRLKLAAEFNGTLLLDRKTYGSDGV